MSTNTEHGPAIKWQNGDGPLHESNICKCGEKWPHPFNMVDSSAVDESALEACRNLLWHYYRDRENGWEPGGFITKLIDVWEVADQDNSARLARAFPALGIAVNLIQSGGQEALIEYTKRAGEKS